MTDPRFATDPSDVGAPNGHSLLETTKTNVSAAFNSATNGPVVQNVKDQRQKTSDELANLAAARKTPSTSAATGQSLTHYHSFFTELLSWNNPRASAIAYAGAVSIIFASRYLDVLRWGFKLTWMLLGVTIAAEVAGKLLLNNGLTSQVRPRKYYVLPREKIDVAVGDVHELINFFVIEAQRLVFAENMGISILTALAAFLSYYLVKIVPYWGLAVIATTVAFFTPLIYNTNKNVIDDFIHQISAIVGDQTRQLCDVASKHTSQATNITKQYMGDYTAKAQQILTGHTSPEPVKTDSTAWNKVDIEPVSYRPSQADSALWKATKTGSVKEPDISTVPKTGLVKESDFPAVPKSGSVKESDFPTVPTREPVHLYAEGPVPVVHLYAEGPAKAELPKTGQDYAPLS